MRCSSYCTADKYLIKDNLTELKKYDYRIDHIENVLHLNYKADGEERYIDVFLFPFGCTIFWGATEEEEIELLNQFKSLEKHPIGEPHSEYIDYDYNLESARTYIDEEKNIVYLGGTNAIIKLSVSHALAQSVKLYELEENVIALLDKTKPIQKELAQKGQVSLSKSEISKQIGTLFSTKYSINMHSDILDTPEFFWRRPSFEPIYDMTVEFLDIHIRQGILNNYLNIIHELYTMLSNELKHKHSTRIEVVIVLLIAIEVILALYKENFIGKFISWVSKFF